MVTGVIQKLQQGTPWEKITQSWRTAALMEEVSQLLKRRFHIYSLATSKEKAMLQQISWPIGDVRIQSVPLMLVRAKQYGMWSYTHYN